MGRAERREQERRPRPIATREDPGGVARIRFNHLFAPNFVFIVDDLTTGIIPEPATGLLVGLGLAGLGALRKRRSG